MKNYPLINWNPLPRLKKVQGWKFCWRSTRICTLLCYSLSCLVLVWWLEMECSLQQCLVFFISPMCKFFFFQLLCDFLIRCVFCHPVFTAVSGLELSMSKEHHECKFYTCIWIFPLSFLAPGVIFRWSWRTYSHLHLEEEIYILENVSLYQMRNTISG